MGTDTAGAICLAGHGDGLRELLRSGTGTAKLCELGADRSTAEGALSKPRGVVRDASSTSCMLEGDARDENCPHE